MAEGRAYAGMNAGHGSTNSKAAGASKPLGQAFLGADQKTYTFAPSLPTGTLDDVGFNAPRAGRPVLRRLRGAKLELTWLLDWRGCRIFQARRTSLS